MQHESWLDAAAGAVGAQSAPNADLVIHAVIMGAPGFAKLKSRRSAALFSIACGYPDANDTARLATNPIDKLLLDRDLLRSRRCRVLRTPSEPRSFIV